MDGSSNSNVDGESLSVTPSQKLMLLKSVLQPLNVDLLASSHDDNSSVNLTNGGCESPISSWDSEPETDIPSFISCDGKPDMEEQNQFVGVENADDGFLWEMDNRSYEELLKKFMEKEEELRLSNFKLQLSEQENIKLKVQAENSDGQLYNMSKELKLKEEELHKLKELSEEEIFELKFQIEKSENQLDIVQKQLNLKEEELNIQKELSKIQLDIAQAELNLKEIELDMQKEQSEEEIFKLKIQIEKSENQLYNVQEQLNLTAEELHIQKKEHSEEEKIFELEFQIEESEIQLYNMQEELDQKEEELNIQKKLSEEEIFKLKYQIEKSEKQIDVAHEMLKLSKDENKILRKELWSKLSETHQLQNQLKVAQDNTAKLELEFASEQQFTQMLEGLVIRYENNEINHKEEVHKLKLELLDLQGKLSLDIASLSELKMQLTSKLEDYESRNKKLENKLREYEIKSMCGELGERRDEDDREVVNKELEAVKKELDMARNELDKANVKIYDLNVELNYYYYYYDYDGYGGYYYY